MHSEVSLRNSLRGRGGTAKTVSRDIFDAFCGRDKGRESELSCVLSNWTTLQVQQYDTYSLEAEASPFVLIYLKVFKL